MSNSNTSKNKFINKLVGFSIGPAINTIIGFVTVPLTTYFLFPEELGKASMYTTSVEILSSFVYLGLANSHAREYKVAKDKSQLLLNCVMPPLLIAAIIAFISIILRSQISVLLFGEYSLFGMILFSVTMPIRVFERFSASVIRMEERAKLYSFHQILQKSVSFILLLCFFLFLTPTYHAVLLSSIGSIFINSISQIFFMKNIWKNALKSKLNKELLKKILAFGLPLIPAAALIWVFNSADKIVLRKFSNFQEIGFYSGAFKIIALLNVFKKSFINFWIPTSYRWYETNESIEKFQKVSDYLMSIFITLSGLAIVSKGIIFKILSEKYLPSANVFPFLLFIPIVATVSGTTMVGIQFKRKTHYEIYSALIVALFNITGNIILVPKLGAVGAAISTGISYIIFFYMRSIMSNKVWLKIKLYRHTVNIILLTTLATLSILPNIHILFELLCMFIIIGFNFKILLNIFKIALKAIKKKVENGN